MSPLGVMLFIFAVVGSGIVLLWAARPDPDYLAGREKGTRLQYKGKPLDACAQLKGHSSAYIRGCREAWTLVHEEKSRLAGGALPAEEAATSAIDQALVDARAHLVEWNAVESNAIRDALQLQYSNYGPPYRCWVGYAADLPGTIMVTVLWSSGFFLQFDPVADSVGHGGQAHYGDFYQTGASVAEQDASAYQCSLYSDGSLAV